MPLMRDDSSPRTVRVRTPRARLARAVLLGFTALTAITGAASAEDKKPDWWCGVIEKQIDHNRDEARKPHDSAGTERLREERRRLDKDAHERHCPGH